MGRVANGVASLRSLRKEPGLTGVKNLEPLEVTAKPDNLENLEGLDKVEESPKKDLTNMEKE